MPQDIPITPSEMDQRFDALVAQIRAELDAAIAQARAQLHQARLRAYWRIGRHIAESFLDEDFRRRSGESLYRRLQQQTGYKERVLQHMVQFYRVYPQFPQESPLTWTHYRYLIGVPDEAARRRYEQEMIAQGISSAGVKQFIPKRNARDARRVMVSGGRLEFQRGTPYMYAIRKGTGLNGEPFAPRLDLGFHMAIDSARADYIRFIETRLVVSHKEEEGYRLETCRGSGGELYTYGARVDRIVDGDTLVARVDLGFGLVSHQRLRLRGINAPESPTQTGQQAKARLTEMLGACPRVVVKTYKNPGMYGRYLTDLFIRPGSDDVDEIAQTGEFVNQCLLDEGLAEIYQG